MSEAARRIAGLSPAQRELLLRRLRERRAAAGEDGSAGAPALPDLVPRPEERHLPFPLTPVQEVYWIGRSGLFDLSQVGANGYFELHFERFGEGDAGRLAAAFDHAVRRHDMLRAVLAPDGTQRVLPEVPRLRLPVVDLSGVSPAAAEARLAAARRRLHRARAAVDRWPSFELELYRLAAGARLLVRFELLFLDGETRLVVFRDLFRRLAGEGVPAPVGCTFRDVAETWRRFRAGAGAARHRDYWRRRLATLPPAVELPLVVPPSPRVPSRWRVRAERLLEPAAWGRLKERAAALRLTPSQVVTAAFLDVLARWSPRRRFSLALEGTFNPAIHPALPEVVGNFNSTTLVSVESWPETFEERALALREQLAGALEHAAWSGFLVLREWNRRQAETSAVAQPIVFNSLLEMSTHRPDLGPMPLPYRYLDAGMYPPQLLLVNTVVEAGGALLGRWKAVEEVLAPGLVPALVEAYGGLLARLAADDAAWRAPWRDEAPRLLPAAQRAAREAPAAEPAAATLAAAAAGLAERLALGPGDRVAWAAPAAAEPPPLLALAARTAGAALVAAGEAAAAPADATVWAGGSVAAEALAAAGVPAALRLALVAGDRVPAPLVAALRRRRPDLAVGWLVGPPAPGGGAALALAAAGEPWPAPLVPLPGWRLRVLDEEGDDCPDWVLGEAAWAGPALGDPPPADPRFARCPRTGEPLLPTGELARHRPDRGVELLGAMDTAAFSVAGHRLVAREVEEDLEAVPGVRRAVVAPAEEAGRRRAVAWVLAAPRLAPAAIEERLAGWPPWRVPATVLLVDRLPADAATGGVDRARLPSPPPPPRAGAGGGARTALEAELAGLWAEVLARPAPIESDRGFYELGGDSLLLARLAERLRRRFGDDLPLDRFFLDPTVSGLAALLLGRPPGAVVDRRLVPSNPKPSGEDPR